MIVFKLTFILTRQSVLFYHRGVDTRLVPVIGSKYFTNMANFNYKYKNPLLFAIVSNGLIVLANFSFSKESIEGKIDR